MDPSFYYFGFLLNSNFICFNAINANSKFKHFITYFILPTINYIICCLLKKVSNYLADLYFNCDYYLFSLSFLFIFLRDFNSFPFHQSLNSMINKILKYKYFKSLIKNTIFLIFKKIFTYLTNWWNPFFTFLR